MQEVARPSPSPCSKGTLAMGIHNLISPLMEISFSKWRGLTFPDANFEKRRREESRQQGCGSRLSALGLILSFKASQGPPRG